MPGYVLWISPSIAASVGKKQRVSAAYGSTAAREQGERDRRGAAQNGGDMLAEDIDFYQVFKIHPTSMVLLTSDLEIVDANDEFLEEVGRDLDDLIGHHLFEEFPKMPERPGDYSWTAVEAAMTSGRREHHLLFREDIEDTAHPGVFIEHYWSSVAQPVRGRDGEVAFIEFSLRDVTPIIDEYRVLQSEGRQFSRAAIGRSDCGLLSSIG